MEKNSLYKLCFDSLIINLKFMSIKYIVKNLYDMRLWYDVV